MECEQFRTKRRHLMQGKAAYWQQQLMLMRIIKDPKVPWKKKSNLVILFNKWKNWRLHHGIDYILSILRIIKKILLHFQGLILLHIITISVTYKKKELIENK